MLVIKKADEGNKIIVYSIIIIAMLSASGYLFYKQFAGNNEVATTTAPTSQPITASTDGTPAVMPIPGSSGTTSSGSTIKINLNSVDLKKIIDVSIFNDPKFNSLIDSTLDRQPSLVGTKNPFGQ
jgi:hypothetical protein